MVKIVKQLSLRDTEPGKFMVYFDDVFKDVFVFKQGYPTDSAWNEEKAFEEAKKYAILLKENNGEVTKTETILEI